MALFEALAELVGAAIISTAPGLQVDVSRESINRLKELPGWVKENGGGAFVDAVVEALARDIWLGAETRSLSQQLLEHHATAISSLLLIYRPQNALLMQAIERARTGPSAAGSPSEPIAGRISVDIFSRAKEAGALRAAGLKDDVALVMIDRVYGHLLDDPGVALALAEPLARFLGIAPAAMPVSTSEAALLSFDLSAAGLRALERAGGVSLLADLRERFSLSERAIARLLKLVDTRGSDQVQFSSELERLAAWVGDVKAQLNKPSNEEAEVRRLKGKAAAAMADGEFEAAADALRHIRREIRESRRRTEERLADEVAGLRSQMAEEARATARLAEIKLAAQDFAVAAELFGEAALALPSAERETAWRFDLQRAEALLGLGVKTGDQKSLGDAASTFAACVRIAAELSDRRGLGQASLGLGTVLSLTGEHDSKSTARLKDAVGPLRKAAGIFAREADVENRLQVQLRLGRVLALIGERDKSIDAFREASDAYREALKAVDPKRNVEAFVAAQMGLGNALLSLEEREGGTELSKEAARAYGAALEQLDRGNDAARWGDAQMNFGIASLGLGEQAGGDSHLKAAVEAFAKASEISTREAAPQKWALLKLNLGNAYASLGEKENGSVEHIENCIAAYTAALEEFRREAEPLKWAITQMNLGSALIRLGEHREKRRHWLAAAGALVPALEVFEAQGATQYAEIARQSLRRFHESWDQLLSPQGAEAPAAPRQSKAG